MLNFILFLLVVAIAGFLVLSLNGTLKRLKHVNEAPYPTDEKTPQAFRAPFLPRNDSHWHTRTFERPRRYKKG